MRISIAAVLVLCLLAIHSRSQNHLFIGAGTIFGGALADGKIENATGFPQFGSSIDFGVCFPVNNVFHFVPSVSFDHRRFKYSATERNDTIVLVEVMGTPSYVPTYYFANIDGRVNSGGLSLNLLAKKRLFGRSWIVAGIYGALFLYKNDQVDVNVRIGEGGLLPDADESHNNKANMRNHEFGVVLGGKYQISNKFGIGISGLRALSSLYVVSGVKNPDNQHLKFYSTYARIVLTYTFGVSE
jgi:hypothetical protein